MPKDGGAVDASGHRARRGMPRGVVILPMLALIALAFVSALALSLSAEPAPAEDVDRPEGDNI